MSSLYYGGNSMSSMDEYLNRINNMHRTPTTVIIDDSQEAPRDNHKDHHHVQVFHHQQAPPAPVHKKVHFTESEERFEVDRAGVCEERTIDMEADGFIQKRHKNFESCNTYKGY